MHTPSVSVFRFLQILCGGALRILCEGYPVYTGYARYENSNLVSRNYSSRNYCTSSNSNLVNRTYCPKPSKLDQRLRSICTRLDEGIVTAGIRMVAADDKIADFTVYNYAALKLKHPQRETFSIPDPTDIGCFSTSEFFVHKALMSFPN